MNSRKKFYLTILGILFSMIFLQAQPTDNIIAIYPLNGDPIDVTGNGNTGTPTNVTYTNDRLGKIVSACSFNGLNSDILLPNALLPNSKAFCISFWFLPNGDNTCGGIASEGLIDLRGQYQIALTYNPPLPENTTNPNSIGFNICSTPTSGAIVTANNSITVGGGVLSGWYHIVANYGNDSMQLFVNGTLIETQIVNPASAVTPSSTYNNTIGKDYTTITRCYLNGTMDEIVIYERKLTTSEVGSIYTNGLTTPFPYPQPVNYTSDLAGNRIGRKIIQLKRYKYINTPDSVETPINKIDSVGYTDLNNEVKIYPNPTRGQLNVVVSGGSAERGDVYVYDLSGKAIIYQTIQSSSSLVDLSGYANGIYVMRIRLGSQTSTWKIIKE